MGWDIKEKRFSSSYHVDCCLGVGPRIIIVAKHYYSGVREYKVWPHLLLRT